MDSITKRLDDVIVTLTAKDLAFRERAREAGIPDMVVSLYAEALQRLVEDEREECAKVAETPIYGEQDDITMAAKDRIAAAIRARGEK